MDIDKIMKIGNEVRVRSKTGTFVTTIDELTGEDSFTILVPYMQREQLETSAGEKYSITCVTETGLYMFDADAIKVTDTANVRVIEIKVYGELRRVQRRQAFRVRESITVNARKKRLPGAPDTIWVKTSTIDISEQGALLRFNEECRQGQELELSLKVNLFGINEVLSDIKGTVVRCKPTKNKEFGFLLGVRFDKLADKARDTLIRLVVLSQRNNMSLGINKKPR